MRAMSSMDRDSRLLLQLPEDHVHAVLRNVGLAGEVSQRYVRRMHGNIARSCNRVTKTSLNNYRLQFTLAVSRNLASPTKSMLPVHDGYLAND